MAFRRGREFLFKTTTSLLAQARQKDKHGMGRTRLMETSTCVVWVRAGQTIKLRLLGRHQWKEGPAMPDWN